MARIVYSGLVTEIKGSIGGTTFQSNRSGYIVRNKQYKGPVRSVGNVKAGRAFAIASRRWGSLTAAQRTAYNTMASTYNYVDLWGNTKTLTGFQWFMASTNNQFRVDGVGLPLAPSGDPTVVAPIFDILLEDQKITYTNFNWAGSNANSLLVYASSPLRSNSFNNRLNYRYMGIAYKENPTWFQLVFDYQRVFGVPYSFLINDFVGYINFLTVFFINGLAGHSSFVLKQLSFNI